MSHYQPLLEQLKQLRLGGLVDSLELRLKEAEKQQLSYLDFLSLLIQDELQRRSQSKFARRLKKACFADLKTLEEFDFKFNPALERRRIYDLGTGHFIENKDNLCLCGPVGVGKSPIALALGHEAVRRGFEVRYIQAPRLFRTLQAAHADLSRDRLMKHYCSSDFLIIDDFGLKPLTDQQADDRYDIVYERYPKGSLMLTSNRSVQEWMGLFPDPIQANSLLDRLGHNAHQLEWEGESYRRRRGATGQYRAGHPLRLRTQVRRLAQWRSRTAHRKSALLQSHSGGGCRQPSFGLVSGVQSVASLAARTALLEGPEGPSNFPGGNCLGKLFPSKTNKTRERRDDDDSQSGGITLVTGWGIYLGD